MGYELPYQFKYNVRRAESSAKRKMTRIFKQKKDYKLKARYIVFAMVRLLVASCCFGCGKEKSEEKAKVVKSVDDLEGSNIGVQL